jgi:hypothetical protein
MNTTMSHALPETVSDVTPVAEAIDPTVLVRVAPVATAGHGHSQPKKVVVRDGDKGGRGGRGGLRPPMLMIFP